MRKPSTMPVRVCLLAAGMVVTATGLTRFSTGSGDWGAAETWAPPGVPTADDTVVIGERHSVVLSGASHARRVEVNSGGALTCTGGFSLTIGGQLHNMGTVSFTQPFTDTLSVGDTLRNHAGATLTMGKHPLVVAGPFVNEGSFTRRGCGATSVEGGLENSGAITWTAGTGTGPITASGDFTNRGVYANNGPGGLTVGGNFANAATAEFNNAYAALEFNGDFTNDQPGAFFGVGTVTFGGADATIGGAAATAFYQMTVNKSERGNHLTLGCDLAVGEGGLGVDVGTLAVGGRQLTLGTGAGAGSVVVDGGGTFSAVGSGSDADAVVTASSADYPYRFEVSSGGRIAARNAAFRWMDAGGIVISGGAVIDPAHSFSDCSFDHGSLAGPMLEIENDDIRILANVNFNGSAGYNIEKLTGAGYIAVIGGTGTRWGESYDNDPGDRIDWVPTAVREQPGLPHEPQARAATIVRAALNMGQRLTADGSRLGRGLYDTNGRGVMALRPGANDVRHLAPGVYFVWPETGNRLDRVVIAR